ncbi:MAG: DUF1998 domain-containing protein [Opitutaceae bacterium]|jgi:hypothetical protein|nr:DUF1998 domain-containing protein [Opitutaceae bacterium]
MSKNEIRASQLLTTFGAGAMMDQPDGSVIIGGLDSWHYGANPPPIVEEPRLLAKLRARLQRNTLTLRTPPPSTDDPTAGRPNITVFKFPRCYLVQKPEPRIDYTGQPMPEHMGSRRRIALQSELNNGKFASEGKRYEVVPLRFVRACEHGHLSDIDWQAYVHGHAGGCGAPIYLEERSTSGALVDVDVICSSCGARRTLADAAIKGTRALGRCDGRRPWLGNYKQERCSLYSRLLIRSASNAYFPQILSIISIPDKKSPVDDIVRQLWNDGLSVVANDVKTLNIMRQIPNIANRLAGIPDAEVLASVARIAAGVAAFVERPVKEVEYEAFAESAEELGSDQPDGDFFARSLPKNHWTAPWMKGIRNVILVHRLREVIAQVAFTRFESVGTDINGELPDEEEISLKVNPAPLGQYVDWLPAVENRGEGVFLVFDETQITTWVDRPKVIARAVVLKDGFDEWKRLHKSSKRQFPGAPYYMLHTFAHLLMTAISLDCGYPASSLRERIYAFETIPDGKRCFGVLIYTASSDAEGTLGGLVEAARRISEFVRKALDLATLCSNDPICAHHAPGEHDHALLHGAACHGCVLVPETSCEQRNEFLDRALVVATVENCDAGFFDIA